MSCRIIRLGSVSATIRIRDLDLDEGVFSGSWEEVGTTNGAGVVIDEPGVDALGVEHVATVWDQTQRFVALELVEAHGAFQRGPTDLDSLHGGVDEGRERVDDVAVEATMSPVVASAADGDCEVEPPSQSTLSALASVDGEEAKDEEHDDKDHQYDGHRFVEFQPRDLVRRWWRQRVW